VVEALQNFRIVATSFPDGGLTVPISNAAFGFEPVLEIVPVLGASRQEQLVCEVGDIGI
jgi:hypothetical protein